MADLGVSRQVGCVKRLRAPVAQDYPKLVEAPQVSRRILVSWKDAVHAEEDRSEGQGTVRAPGRWRTVLRVRPYERRRVVSREHNHNCSQVAAFDVSSNALSEQGFRTHLRASNDPSHGLLENDGFERIPEARRRLLSDGSIVGQSLLTDV